MHMGMSLERARNVHRGGGGGGVAHFGGFGADEAHRRGGGGGLLLSCTGQGGWRQRIVRGGGVGANKVLAQPDLRIV